MDSKNFNIVFNIANILLLFYMLVCVYLYADADFYVDKKKELFEFFILLVYIFSKFALLPFIFFILVNVFKIPIVNDFQNELIQNEKSRMKVLGTTFKYDLFLVIVFVCINISSMYFEVLFLPLFYEMITVGGITVFYLFQYFIWEFQGKIKE